MKSLFYRPTQLAVAAFVALSLLSLGILGALSWRNQERIRTIQVHVTQTHAVEQVGLKLQRLLLEDISGVKPVDRLDLLAVRDDVAGLSSPGVFLAPDTVSKLNQVLAELSDVGQDPKLSLIAALRLMKEVLVDEADAEAKLLQDLQADVRAEVELATLALLTLPALLLATGWIMRQRIFKPINDLKELLARLTAGQFTPIPVANVDPLVVPLLDNYNRMVTRLAELEQANREHADNLEAEVRSATQVLLQQQQSLSRAERLAAVGEVSAGLAHELRNPLAGIHLTLTNLRRELGEGELAERLDLVITESERVTRLLNNLLSASRHSPEAARTINVSEAVRQLLALIRYQVPVHVKLEVQGPPEVLGRLPEDRLRQALLNLVLNAVQALGNSPGTVTVAVEKGVDGIRLTVSDDGPGFPEEMLEYGVRPFVSGRDSGTGLGLAMAQRFARDLGGKMTLSNRTPHGACVTLTLPCEASDG